MALTPEDGSGLTDADSYDTLANVDAYLALYGAGAGATWSALADAVKENHIRTATRYLDAQFGPASPGRRFKGVRTYQVQALAWPRARVKDADGYVVDSSGSDSIPQALKNTMAVLAEKSASEDLMPDQANPGSLSSKRVKVGSLEVEKGFVGGSRLAKFYRLAEGMLAPLLEPAGELRRA